jgi:hypothetical protein
METLHFCVPFHFRGDTHRCGRWSKTRAADCIACGHPHPSAPTPAIDSIAAAKSKQAFPHGPGVPSVLPPTTTRSVSKAAPRVLFCASALHATLVAAVPEPNREPTWLPTQLCAPHCHGNYTQWPALLSFPFPPHGSKLLGKKGGRGCLTLARDDKP